MRKLHTQEFANDEEEVARIALELYERDRERDQDTRSLQDALKEMAVPPRYVEVARRQLEKEKLKRAGYGKKSFVWIYYVIAFGVLAGGLLLATFWSTLSPARPLNVGFANAFSHWTLEANPETAASFSVEQDNGEAVGRITVDHFGSTISTPPRGNYAPTDYSVTLSTIQQSLDIHGLKTLSFRARGNGIRAFRLETTYSGSANWRSPRLTLSKDWQTYDLDLTHDGSDSPNPWARFDGADHVSVVLDDQLNNHEERGTIDIGPLRFH
jgi:hypothetical protein